MYNSGDAAEQVVRISLEGTEVALKLTGSAAKNIAAMLYAVWKNRDKNKTKGHQRLSAMRQFVFSVLAILVAVGLHFLLKPHFGTETVSWMCILGAAPFAALGFITYHGMTAEQFLWAWLRSELLEPKELRFEASNLYYEALKDKLEEGKS